MRLATTFLVTVVGALLACGGSKDPNAVLDDTKSAAIEITPGATADDMVSSSDDEVDWKRFNVGERSPATVNIYWDNPDIKAKVALRDTFGATAGELEHAAGAPKDTISVPALADGTYFIEVRALKGSSVYTVEVILGNPDEGGSYGVPRPE